MGLSGAIRSHPLMFLFGLAAVSLLALFILVPPIPQPQDYHRFADQKTLLGIPNFWNVVSNLPFILSVLSACGRSAICRRAFSFLACS